MVTNLSPSTLGLLYAAFQMTPKLSVLDDPKQGQAGIFQIISIFKKVVKIGNLIRLSQKGLYSAEAALQMLRIDSSLMLNAGFIGVDNPENMYLSASASVTASSSASASAST